jgi:DNA-binding response OmpR family regulator
VIRENRERPTGPDRRRFPRGGRRAGDPSGRHPTIAIIEQYEGVRRPCARYLDHFHFDVAEAVTADQGLGILQQTNPAVILMEDVDSAGSVDIQQQARDRAIPIVAMASAFGGAATEHAEPLGAAGVLVKPFQLGVMLEEIRRVLRARVAD